jgi:uncharacterized protein YheU (UPF0270 family)
MMEAPKPPIQISPEDLQESTLKAVIESFVLREGTDYGDIELSLDLKIKNLKIKLQRNEVVLVFDPNQESLTFLTKREWQQLCQVSL